MIHKKLMYQPTMLFFYLCVNNCTRCVEHTGGKQDDGANPGGTNVEDQLLSLVVMAKGK